MKIIVFDDDPTGSQTVYGCPLLLNWQEETVSTGLANASSMLFVLANTRSMAPQKVEITIREICKSIKQTLQNQKFAYEDILFVSRGDSTLRGHGVLEPEILSQELGPFDATFHVPSFFEGARTTIDGKHLLNGLPVHLSNFAADKIFGYSTSYLPDWLEEKSKGQISSANVLRLSIEQLESAIDTDDGMEELCSFLKVLSQNVSVVVDATELSHLSIFAKAVIKLRKEKRFLFRSAASLISAFAQLPINSYTPSSLAALRLKNQSLELKGGLIMVGSHVHLADQQLEALFKHTQCESIELPVKKISRILDGSLPDILLTDLENIWLAQLKKILISGKTPVLFTSRGELSFPSFSQRILFGSQLAELMSRLVAKLIPHLGYVISKGGITTQTFLTQGLNLDMIELKGQILPGLSMVCPYNENNLIQIPIITFPGNLGDSKTLLEAWRLMENGT